MASPSDITEKNGVTPDIYAIEIWLGKSYNFAVSLKDFFHLSLGAKISVIFSAKKKREEMLEDIEEQLILADVSLEVAQKVVRDLAKRLSASSEKEDCYRLLREDFLAILSKGASPPRPSEEKEVLVLVGVNGSGKTTTAAKLAHFYRGQGRKVFLCAADTFRAAGSLQLELWGNKLGIPVVEGERGADPGAVVYRGLDLLSHREYDLMIVDTAGRVQTKENLMRELEKTVKIIKKRFPQQPCETLLVLDATTGQNALIQAEKFREFSGISGLALVKMDGTAKGGTVISIADRLGIPVRYLGVGEGAGDLLEFSVPAFIDALIGP